MDQNNRGYWNYLEDGTGYYMFLGRICFIYNAVLYASEGWIEYQRTTNDAYCIFEGSLSEFKKYAEQQLKLTRKE